MNKVQLHVYVLVGLLLVVLPAVRSADFEEGHEAFYRGDYSTALKVYKPLAEQGHAEAQLNMAHMYQGGFGVPQDDREAVRWYRRAADQGLAEAQSQLGTMYFHGRGVRQDYSEVAKWYQKAAEQNDPSAIFNLASMYANGLGFRRDYGQALRLGLITANMDNIGGQMLVAQLYQSGAGVKRDKVQALKWFLIVASKSDFPWPEHQALGAQASAASRSLMAGMTEEDIREAVRLSEEWRPSAVPTQP